jgi:hypothetical protein
MSKELAIAEQEQIVTGAAMLLVEALNDAGPTALHAASNYLRDQSDDFAVAASKRLNYKAISELVKQEARR